MLVLRPLGLHWISEEPDDRKDLCAHSVVEFRVDDRWVIEPDDGDWAVSAAALRLLRSLSRDHDLGTAEPLFPHCGHSMLTVPGSDDVAILNCFDGADVGVRRVGDQVQLIRAELPSLIVAWEEWQKRILAFSDEVAGFYARSSPKQPSDPESAAGFAAFMAEWRRRRSSF